MNAATIGTEIASGNYIGAALDAVSPCLHAMGDTMHAIEYTANALGEVFPEAS